MGKRWSCTQRLYGLCTIKIVFLIENYHKHKKIFPNKYFFPKNLKNWKRFIIEFWDHHLIDSSKDRYLLVKHAQWGIIQRPNLENLNSFHAKELKNSQGYYAFWGDHHEFSSLQLKTAPKKPPKDVINSSNGITITVTLMHVQHYTKQKYIWVKKGHKRSW